MKGLALAALLLALAACSGSDGPTEPGPVDFIQGDWLSTIFEIEYQPSPPLPATILQRRWWLSIAGAGCEGGFAGDGINEPTSARNGPWPCSFTVAGNGIVIELSVPQPSPAEDGDLVFSGTIFDGSLGGAVEGDPASDSSVPQQEMWFVPDS